MVKLCLWLVKYIIALSPIDSVALIAMRHPKSSQKGQVLDPCWTLERNSPELDVQHSARFQFRRSRISGITSRPYRSSATRVVSLNAVWPATATFPSTRLHVQVTAVSGAR